MTDIADDTVGTNEDTAVTFNALANDSFEGSPVITGVTQGSNGSVVIGAGGQLTYTPDANFNGVDSFTYTVTSPAGITETATVTINVAAINDAPVNTVPGSQSTNEDTSLAIAGVSVADTDSASVTTTVAVNNGTLSVTAAPGATIADNGTGSVQISGAPAAVNAALAGLTYTNTADYNGADMLTMTTTDGSLSDVDTVAITVNAVVDIADDSVGTNEDTAVTFNALANDSFEGSPVITGVTQGGNGSVVIGAGGQLTYTPNADFTGADTFTYTVTSPAGITETATVTVNVAAINDAPVNTVPGAQSTNEDTSLAIAGVSVADTDSASVTTTLAVDNGTLSVTAAPGATITDNGTGSVQISGAPAAVNAALAGLTYTNTADYNGADTLTDHDNGWIALSDVDTVAITVNAVVDIADDTCWHERRHGCCVQCAGE